MNKILESVITTDNRQGAFIEYVSVKKLFGHFDYHLDFANRDFASDKLSILYGDNGCGKTTVLQMLYHLLSPIDNRGHKSILAKIVFSEFEVGLSNNVTVYARRTGDTASELSLSVSKDGSIISKLNLKIDKEGNVRSSSDDVEGGAFLVSLRSFNLELFFLRDNRRLTSSFDDTPADETDRYFYKPFDSANAETGNVFQSMSIKYGLGRGVADLSDVVDNVNIHFRSLVTHARNRGEADINNIYAEIVKHLIRPHGGEAADTLEAFNRIMNELQQLSQRNMRFSKLGLTTELSADAISDYLREAPADARAVLLNVLRPYVDGVNARLDALESVQNLISRLVDTLNTFLEEPKQVRFDLAKGLVVQGFSGEILHPERLSSGEQQLLTIFCHLVRPKGHPSVFIIDEPELSLNIKWQRKLIQSLLECTEGAPIQLILASHSMEILSQHRQQVVVMKSLRA